MSSVFLRSKISPKVFAICLAVISTLFMLSGCSTTGPAKDATSAAQEKNGQKPEKSFEGVTINMLRHSNANEVPPMQKRLDQLHQETGLTVKMETVAFANLHDKIVLDASTNAGSFDVIALCDYWLGEFCSGGWLAPLDDYLADKTLYGVEKYNVDDVVTAMWDMNSYNGQIYSIPWKLNNVLFVYRNDLISSPPKTWDEWLEVAAENTKDGVYGVGLSLKPTASDLFLTLLYSNGGSVLSDDMKTCLLDGQEALETLEFIKALQKYSLPGAINRGWDESVALFGQGNIASDIYVSTYTNNLDDPKFSTIVDKTSYAAPPYNKKPATASNTWSLGVLNSSKHKEAAAVTCMALTDSNVSRQYTLDLNLTPVRNSLLADKTILEKNRVMAVQADIINTCIPRPHTASVAAMTDIIGNEIQAFLMDQKDAKKALLDAKAAIDNLL